MGNISFLRLKEDDVGLGIGLLKSGIPADVEMPAPARMMTFLTTLTKRRYSMASRVVSIEEEDLHREGCLLDG